MAAKSRKAKPTKPVKPRKARTLKGRIASDPKTGLTKSEAAFADHYAIHGRGCEAYRHAFDAANTSPKAVAANVKRLLKKRAIRLLIDQRRSIVREKAEAKFEVSAERIVQRTAAIAFGDLRHLASWGSREVRKTTKDGDTYTDRQNFVDLKDSADLDDAAAFGVAGVEASISRDGRVVVNLKRHDSLAALRALHTMCGYDHPEKIAVDLKVSQRERVERLRTRLAVLATSPSKRAGIPPVEASREPQRPGQPPSEGRRHDKHR